MPLRSPRPWCRGRRHRGHGAARVHVRLTSDCSHTQCHSDSHAAARGASSSATRRSSSIWVVHIRCPRPQIWIGADVDMREWRREGAFSRALNIYTRFMYTNVHVHEAHRIWRLPSALLLHGAPSIASFTRQKRCPPRAPAWGDGEERGAVWRAGRARTIDEASRPHDTAPVLPKRKHNIVTLYKQRHRPTK